MILLLLNLEYLEELFQEYLYRLLKKDIHILVYNSFVNKQSLFCYDTDNDGMELWNSDEDYTKLSDIDTNH